MQTRIFDKGRLKREKDVHLILHLEMDYNFDSAIILKIFWIYDLVLFRAPYCIQLCPLYFHLSEKKAKNKSITFCRI